MIKAIIFDCWDTLFFTDKTPHPFGVLANIIGMSFDDYDFLKKFEKHLMLEKVDTLNDSIVNLLNDLNIKPEEELVDGLSSLLVEGNKLAIPFPETLNVLKELKSEYKLGLVTNTSYPSYKSLQDRYNISNLFDVVVTSYDCKCIKPDGRIFNTALQKLGVEPGEALMVGDSHEDDILASRKLGMGGLLIDRKNKYQGVDNKIASLTEIAAKV